MSQIIVVGGKQKKKPIYSNLGRQIILDRVEHLQEAIYYTSSLIPHLCKTWIMNLYF